MSTKGGRREADMDRLLRTALARREPERGQRIGLPGHAADSDGCLAPEQLAAFVEGSLAPSEAGSVEAHLAACDRCQQALATIAQLPLAKKRTEPFFHVMRLRWLVPGAAAAATAVIVLVAVWPAYRGNMNAPHGKAETRAADIRLQAPEVSAELGTPQSVERRTPVSPNDISSPARPSARTAQKQAFAPLTESPRPRLDAIEAIPAETGAGVGGAVGRGAVATEVKAAPPPAVPQVAIPAPAAPAVPVGSQPPSTPAGRPTQVADAAAARGAALPTAKPKPTTVERLDVSAANPRTLVTPATTQRIAADSLLFRAGVPGVVVQAPGGTIRWRLHPGGAIFRSADAGATWQLQRSGVKTDLLAGSSPSAVVCWVVGQDGTVLVTSDGATWQSRLFPDRVDLTAVQARDAESATVTTRDGRRFTTADGGRTWIVR